MILAHSTMVKPVFLDKYHGNLSLQWCMSSSMVLASDLTTVQSVPPQYFLCKGLSKYRTMQLPVQQKYIVESSKLFFFAVLHISGNNNTYPETAKLTPQASLINTNRLI